MMIMDYHDYRVINYFNFGDVTVIINRARTSNRTHIDCNVLELPWMDQ